MQNKYREQTEKNRRKGKQQASTFAELLASGLSVSECATEMKISHARGYQYMQRIRGELGSQAV